MITRERIIQFLQMYRQATTAEMAVAMGMTQANLRYHLTALRDAGVVECILKDGQSGRGRPAQVFRLAAGGRPDNFGELAGALLTAHFDANITGDEMNQRIHELADILAANAAPSQGSLAQRLGRAVHWLDAHGYASVWEARPQGPALRLRNCPYATQVQRHPALCRIDAALLERLTGLTTRQIARIDLAGGKTPACVFLLRPPAESNQMLPD